MPEYSREQIARAAIAVAESDGLATVTMRRVATEVGAALTGFHSAMARSGPGIDLEVNRLLITHSSDVIDELHGRDSA